MRPFIKIAGRTGFGVRDEPVRTLGVALCLSLAGVVFGGVSAVTVPTIYGAVVPRGTFGYDLLRRYLVQPGFALVALAFIYYRGDITRYVRLRPPSIEGVLWISSGIVVEWGTRLLSEVAFGATHGNWVPKWTILVADPTTIPLALVVIFVVMAPAEELLYRGAVHGRLREGFDVVPRIVAGAMLFGVPHLIFSGGLPSFVVTSITGLGLATAYERTDNLVVPIGMHGVIWLLAPL